MKKKTENDTAVAQAAPDVPAVAETGEPKKRKGRQAKVVPVKKLPRMFRRKYSERRYKKTISKHIYIAKDNEFVRGFFLPVEGAKKPAVAIPGETLLTKADAARLKTLAKQIKKQKGRVKWIPLLACVAVVVALGAAVVLFKDALLKKGIQSALQAAFGAKCDIAYLHLGILDSSFNVRGLAVADKNDTMTNLFEVGNITMDFDLVQLLRRRFAADELDVSDVRLGTPRETDGALPPKPEKKKEPSEFQRQLTAFASEKADVLKGSLTGIFEQYNPETILGNFYSQLSSPELVKQVEAQLEAIVPAWQAVPDEITASVNKVISEGQSAADFNWDAVKSDPTRLREGIELVTAALKSVEAVQEQTEQTVDRLRSDTETVQSLARSVQDAVSGDYSLVSGAIDKIASFSIKGDGMQILTDSFTTVLADLLGKYYPMLREGIDTVRQLSSKDSGKEDEKKKEKVARYAGRMVEFRKDVNPSFLIRRAHGSGADKDFALDITMTDISNDMDKWGKPASIQGSAVHGAMSDSISGTLDLRTDRPGDMLELSYNGSGYNVSMALPEEEAIPGVPSAAGTGAFSARLGANEDGSFAIGGTVLLNPVKFTAAAFEPAFASDLYGRALAKLSSVQAGVSVSYSDGSGLDLGITSDIDSQFVRVLTELFNEELASIKEQAMAKVRETLDSATAGLTEKFGSFDDIKGRIGEQTARLESFRAELERKKSDAENQLKAAAEAAVDKATEAAKSKVESAVDSAKDAAADKLKGLFGR